jgi:hypothetical protein
VKYKDWHQKEIQNNVVEIIAPILPLKQKEIIHIKQVDDKLELEREQILNMIDKLNIDNINYKLTS